MPTILVCGGAGYIGAYMCEQLAVHGCRVVVFDSLASGHREAVRYGDLIVGDLRDPRAIDAAFDAHRFDAVMHFEGKSSLANRRVTPRRRVRGCITGSNDRRFSRRTGRFRATALLPRYI